MGFIWQKNRCHNLKYSDKTATLNQFGNWKSLRLCSHCRLKWPKSDFFCPNVTHIWFSYDSLNGTNPFFSNQAQATFICGPRSDTYLQIRPRPLSYVVLDRIHIFKSGPGHFHMWSYIGYISSNQAQATFICGPRSDTYLQISPRPLSYVVLDRIHIFKSGPGHFHMWSYIGYISSNQAQVTFIRGPRSDTYVQIRPRSLSYVVLDRIHIFKSGPGHFHMWS